MFVIIPFASAHALDNGPAELKSVRFVFDSDRDWALDKMISVYLWEGGRAKKLFKGAICPRWSPDGERIACVLRNPEKETGIAILDRSGTMRTEIMPSENAQAVEWLDENNLIYIAQGQGEPDFRKTNLIKYDLSTDNERILYTTQGSGEIYQMNWNRVRDGLILDIKDRFPGEQEFKRRAAFLNVKTGGSPKIIYEWSAYKPALFHDDETLVFQTDLMKDGKPVKKTGDGALAAYNLQTGEWAGVRDASSVQNTRFSRDGNYFYSAEGEGEQAVVIRLFSVEDLNKPLLRVSPGKGEPSWPHKDLRPDLFIPTGVSMAVILSVPLPAKIVGEKTAVKNTVGEKTPTSARLARPRLSARLSWRPDPNRPALERRLPVDREPALSPRVPAGRQPALPESAPPYTVTPMPVSSPPYTVTPMSESVPREGRSTITNMPFGADTSLSKSQTITAAGKKPLSTTPKMTSGANQPLNKISKMTSEANQPLIATNAVRAMAPPVWFKVPPDATPIERGWYYTTNLGDRFTTQYSEDWSSYTVTEEGPNFNSKTTYPVYGARYRQTILK